ncbi:hypothetical protein [Azohydromonas caseinilytica]|uniref:Antitoxin VbhA domain-containing protein n=1 Tax=Azohydromonas caseinilytica TaxID=2728836 RepID=A0A848FGQ4_9BURK|nr:hypothetical protein [Azohydromonas caseinilytica]NML18035.1 hypothetical protein [Azohydromonas caseinilytica]
MHASTFSLSNQMGPPPEYEAAMADIERRAVAGELTLAQAKREIFALRERYAPEPGVVTRWAAHSQA